MPGERKATTKGGGSHKSTEGLLSTPTPILRKPSVEFVVWKFPDVLWR